MRVVRTIIYDGPKERIEQILSLSLPEINGIELRPGMPPLVYPNDRVITIQEESREE